MCFLRTKPYFTTRKLFGKCISLVSDLLHNICNVILSWDHSSYECWNVVIEWCSWPIETFWTICFYSVLLHTAILLKFHVFFSVLPNLFLADYPSSCFCYLLANLFLLLSATSLLPTLFWDFYFGAGSKTIYKLNRIVRS